MSDRRKVVKFNWEQSGMPVSLVSRMGLRNDLADYKSVLRDARDQVLTPVDAEAMAKELVESGGREYVEMVRELTTALANAKQELDAANRRYERLTADLARRGIPLVDETPPPSTERQVDPSCGDMSVPAKDPVADGHAEWEEWDRRFRSLLG